MAKRENHGTGRALEEIVSKYRANSSDGVLDMVRKLACALALVLAVASKAEAQAPFTEQFLFVTGGSNENGYKGEFTSATNIGLTGESINTPFQIWCVDPLHGVDYSMSHTATVTSLANFVSAGTRAADAAHNVVLDFQKAAYLASTMTSANSNLVQQQIWYALGYTSSVSLTTAQKNVVDNMTTAQLNSVTLSEWAIINEGSSLQEFIYHRQGGGTLSVTPEPATMSLMAMGLVGMAGTSIRRRKRNK